jgi:hypothetical protein
MSGVVSEFKTIFKVVQHDSLEVRMQLVGSDKFKCAWEHYMIDQNGNHVRLDPWFSFKIQGDELRFKTQFSRISCWNAIAKIILLNDIRWFLTEHGKHNQFLPQVARFIKDSDKLFADD